MKQAIFIEIYNSILANVFNILRIDFLYNSFLISNFFNASIYRSKNLA